MSLNLTIFGQIITFFIFLFLFYKVIWPRIAYILSERKKEIQLSFLNKKEGENILKNAKEQSIVLIHNAKKKAEDIIKAHNEYGKKIIIKSEIKAKELAKNIYKKNQQLILKDKKILENKIRTSIIENSFLIAEKILKSKIGKRRKL